MTTSDLAFHIAFFHSQELSFPLSPHFNALSKLFCNNKSIHRSDAGLDFVAIRDHPDEPDFLDSISLISVFLGETSKIRFISNIANLPLRPPALLAKSVATLALLSEGRFILGLSWACSSMER
jgi:Luciferase-like monooxygenase